MADSLYEQDALEWAERQATLLTRLARGERVNAEVDWSHVIEEVRDVGLSELRSCQSLIEQALLHMMKLALYPDDSTVRHWRLETAAFLVGARRRFTPSMRQRIDLDELFADALITVERNGERKDDGPSLRRTCPFALDDLLDREIPVSELVTMLRA